MAWIIGVAILAILFVVATLFIIAMPRFKKLQQLIDKLNYDAKEYYLFNYDYASSCYNS